MNTNTGPQNEIHTKLTDMKTFYGNLKIQNKLFIVLLLTVFVVCSISLATLQVTLNVYDEIIYNESAQVLNLSSVSIENELKKIEKLSYSIVSDANIQEYLISAKRNTQSYDRYTAIRMLIDRLIASSVEEKNVAYIIFLDTQGIQYLAGNNAVNVPAGFVKQIEERAGEKEGAITYIEPYDGSSGLILARTVRAAPDLSLEYLGTLMIFVDMEGLVRQSLSPAYKNEVNLVIRSGDKTVYTIHGNFGEDLKERVMDRTNGYTLENINNKKYFISQITSDFTKWKYFNFIPYESVFNKIILIRNILLIVFAVVFFTSIIVSLKLAKNLTKPIDSLAAKMKRVEEGNFEVVDKEGPDNYRLDEIGYLEKDFDMMVVKISNLIQDNYVKQLAVKDAQYKALQAQINPHFLYNTLESINCLAKINNQKSISMMVESLGNLLRSSITTKENVVTLEDEIRLLEYYINIQKIRYEERLDFNMQIGEEFKRCRIPKLTLQPIVENSINYGLENMLDVCSINVKAAKEADYIKVIVEDNGPGIDTETLEKLNNTDFKPRGLGIGLMNIDRRIKIMYGEGFGISVTSGKEKGTTVFIRLPAEGEDTGV